MTERVHRDDDTDRNGSSRAAVIQPRRVDSESPPRGVAGILALQQAAGNDAVGRLLANESSPVQRAPVAAPEAPAAAPAAHPQLSVGSSGPAVSELQEKLRRAVDEAKLEVTGRFDGRTEEVVKRLQVQSGLRPDGIVGNDTWGTLDSLMGGVELSGATLERIAALTEEAGTLFAAGDVQGSLDKNMSVYADPAAAHKAGRGQLVYQIAACHHRLGNFPEAISFYQECMALPLVGGERGGSAAENLRRARLKQPFQSRTEMEAERAALGGEAPTEPHPQLSAGSSGPAVSELQEKLRRAVDEAKLEVTGRFDGQTTEVVKRLQVQSGLRPDGIVGNDTWGALDSLMGGVELSGATLDRIAALTEEASTLFAAGDVKGSLDKNMSVYADPAAAHKAGRGQLVYQIAACHHRLGNFPEAISFYQECMGLPGVGAERGGSAAENLRRARLGQPFQSRTEMEAERAAFNP